MKRRKIYPGEVHHICQMTQGKVVIFYSVRDFLVFYTVYSSFALKRGVVVLALCPMPDHLHNVVIVQDYEQLSLFVKDYTQCYALLWNKSRGRKGDLFHHSFKSSVKLGNKQVRTVLAYNYNNPVERKLVDKAEDYRWNFLAYYRNEHPFSAPEKERTASRNLKRAKQEVKAFFEQGKYLGYTVLDRLYKPLLQAEQQQLTDYIISLWNVIDYNTAITYYGSYESMIRAFHDNTGSDYEIKEDRDNYSDSVYRDCTSILLKDGFIKDVFQIPTLQEKRKRELYELLNLRTTAHSKQLLKYLHLTQ